MDNPQKWSWRIRNSTPPLMLVQATKTVGHPTVRAFTSDWFVNSFIIVIYEKMLLVVLWTKILTEFWLNFKGNSEVRGECSSCRVKKEEGACIYVAALCINENHYVWWAPAPEVWCKVSTFTGTHLPVSF